MATQVIEAKETATVDRAQTTLTLETYLLGRLQRRVVVDLGELERFAIETYKTTMMRKPKYRLYARLATGAVLPLFSTYSHEEPVALRRRLHEFADLPDEDGGESDDDDDVHGDGSAPPPPAPPPSATPTRQSQRLRGLAPPSVADGGDGGVSTATPRSARARARRA